MSKCSSNLKTYYEIPICFNCLKVVNLKHVICSKEVNNYKYIICNCGQIMKVIKENNEEKISRIKRNGKDLKEAYDLFFKIESMKEDNLKNKKQFINIKEIIKIKKEKFELNKKEKKKSKLKLVK
ncbi:MAG: hypothetical protein ACRDD7_03680 [Peptostreptococcaceae bacterium]